MSEASKPVRLICVVGARPNFMKIAPIMRALKNAPIEPLLVHTGQHYDSALSDTFFEQLGLPQPDVNLGVGSASHAVQTAEIMARFEPVLDREKPDGVLVVGDVNSTIACALVAAKKSVAVIHVEAGLRSGDRSMPEEINRVLTDAISDLLFVTERGAIANLEREGISRARAHFAGNVMIDTLMEARRRAPDARQTLRRLGIADLGNSYAVMTLHRPSNVNDARTLAQLLDAMRRLSRDVPIVFPVHPRTMARITESGLSELISAPHFRVLQPIGYLEMLSIMKDARFVLTDSGGLQEETTALGVPCLTLRDNTERPITIEEGTNTLIGTDPGGFEPHFANLFATGGKRGRLPELWDGHAAERIVAELTAFFGNRR